MKTIILTVGGLVIATIAAIAGTLYLMRDLGMAMTFHGWTAYILGGVMTLVLSGGLFFLTFYSARHGHDDIDRPEDEAS